MTILPRFVVSTIVIAALGLGNSAIIGTDGEQGCRSLLEFRCLNGDCIPSEKLCDGQANCKDGSDETRQECNNTGIICPPFAFQCNYGACINSDAKCNGIDDCVDKSDEQLGECRIDSSSNGTCAHDQFRCTNGQCVLTTAICDGAVDCADQSDETSELCSRIICPPFTFQCGYGACIANSQTCNGVRNCRDNSDEDPDLCQGISITRPTPPIEGPTPAQNGPFRRNCRLPLQPSNGRWQLHKSQCQGNDHCDVRNSDDLQPGSRLVYSCRQGYKVNEFGDVYCGPGGRWSSEPVCEEIRCKPLSSASTVATCTYNNDWASCEVPVLPNTAAKVSCRNSYQKDANVLSHQRENVRCNLQGEWVPEPIKCVPECGLIRPNTKPLIVNGVRPKLPEFPWHATIYRAKNAADPNKKFTCGASIIQSNLLITAAHCVYDESYHRVHDPNTMFISTGNAFLDYNHRYNVYAKKANVKDIYVNCNFLGLEGNYAGDIAILRIDRHFTFSSLLMPVCIDDTKNNDLAVLEIGNLGKVAGFGRTGPDPSQEQSQILQSLTVPYVSLSECHAATASSNSGKFITLDKFCAGYTNGSAVCDGDSGGGLVFNTGGLYYLRGIVSTGIGLTLTGGTRSCDSDTYALYTRVSSHIEWIQDVLLKVELYNAYPSCSNRSSIRP